MRGSESRRITVTVEHPLVGAVALELLDVAAALPFERFDVLHLSLRQVEQIDVTGIVALVRLFSHVRRFGKRVRFTEVGDNVGKTLESIGLSDVVDVVPRSALHDASVVVRLPA